MVPVILYKLAKPNNKGISKVSVWSCWSEGDNVVSLSGYEDGKKKEFRYTAKATNVGRSNERTPTEQAAEEVLTSYVSQRDNKHYRTTVEAAREHLESCKVPMKLSNFKDHGSKINYPCYVQKKFNGSRLTVIDGDFISKAGRIEDFKVGHIKRSVWRLGIDFDSEVYRHGLSLQEIQSARLLNGSDTRLLRLVIFDIPLRNTPFSERAKLLRYLRDRVKEEGHCHIDVEVPTLVNNREELIEFYDNSLLGGYEGIVARNLDGIFEFGYRTYDTQKLKPRFDAEALVESVTKDKNGNGKLHVVSSDKLGNVRFKCMMKVKRRDGNEYPRDFDTMSKLIGSWITFSYEELSNSGIPTKPVGEDERPCNDKGEPLLH